MSMVAFHFLFPNIAERETQTMPTCGNHGLPEDTYVFEEFYCVDHNCDCRRVMLGAWSMRRGQHLATINHAFLRRSPEMTHLCS